MASETKTCQICGAAALNEIPGFASLPRVTSDCIPFREGGKLAVCEACGGAQALPDQEWFADIGEIYGKYNIYHQSGGLEQHVFDCRTGQMRRRSDVLVEKLEGLSDTPRSGKLLDVGCGNGVTLRAFSERGNWGLNGLEIHDRNLSHLSQIPGFETLHLGAATDISQSFDLITLVHALEHFPDPCAFLIQLKSKLKRNGVLFIEVPNAAANAFDYVIADHLSHFSPQTLAVLVRRAGFKKFQIFTDWVMKEISLVASLESDDTPIGDSGSATDSSQVLAQVDWLNRVVASAQSAATTTGSFGLFGSSIAATWLWRAVSDRVQFFVEEDPSRVGRTHLGCAIISPGQVPADSSVFLALATTLAESIQKRLQGMPFSLYMPPTAPGDR